MFLKLACKAHGHNQNYFSKFKEDRWNITDVNNLTQISLGWLLIWKTAIKYIILNVSPCLCVCHLTLKMYPWHCLVCSWTILVSFCFKLIWKKWHEPCSLSKYRTRRNVPSASVNVPGDYTDISRSQMAINILSGSTECYHRIGYEIWLISSCIAKLQ